MRTIVILIVLCVPVQCTVAAKKVDERPSITRTFKGSQFQAELTVWGEGKTDNNTLTHSIAPISGRITIEGPANLKVDAGGLLELGKGWKDESESMQFRRIPLPNNRVRFQRDFTVYPDALPDTRPLSLNPVFCRVGESTDETIVTWEPPIQIEIRAPGYKLDTQIPIEKLPTPDSQSFSFPWLLVSVGLFLALFIGAVMWFLIRPQSRPVVPFREQALGELERLEKAHSDATEVNVEVYEQIADVLRNYLDKEFNVPAPRQTTDELADYLTRRPEWKSEDRQSLISILERCDLAKYAQAGSEREEAQELIRHSLEWMKATDPQTVE